MLIKGIVLHLSASNFGDAAQINQWHKENGWSGIGYHFVILNGRRQSSSPYKQEIDGLIEPGRAENIMGAHCKSNSMNVCTLGICSIGNPNQPIPAAMQPPSEFIQYSYLTNQQLNSLINKAALLCIKYNLDPAGNFIHPTTGNTQPVISQHSQHDSGKPLCASLKINTVRQAVVEKYQMLLRNADSNLITFDNDNAVLADDVESIENDLPEFQFPLGGHAGPEELETDINTKLINSAL